MLHSLLLSFTLSTVVSAISDHNNVALYWGQNSAGTQQDLASYCSSEKADIYILSFIDVFGSSQQPNVNFANACTESYSSGLLHCPQIGKDIKTCQSLGKTVLISLGGASGAYGFSDDSTADFAGTLWNMFGGGSDSSVERPFDDAVVDGFDFDIENNNPKGYATLANKLRSYFSEDSSKTYYLSAAPQCPYPDASVGDLLENASIDFAFIQFYNNYCATTGSNFNWDTWNTFAENTSPNKNIKLFVGLPAASGAAGSGYATIDQIKSTFQNTILNKEDSHFGGFVLWDASWSTSNKVNGDTFGNNLQSLLDDSYSGSGLSDATPSNSLSSSSAGSTSSTSLTSSTSSTSLTSSTSSSSSNSLTVSAEESTISQPISASSFSSEQTNSVEQTTSAAATSSTTTSNSIDTNTSESLISPTSMVGEQPALTAQPTPTTLSTSSTSTAATTSTTAGGSGSGSNSGSDCSSLSGLSKAQCLNKNFEQGLYLGGASSCNENDIACASDGSFAICNFGNWVKMPCSAGTTCYAYNNGDQVDVGCDYIDSKSSFEKRDNMLMNLFKRYLE